MELLAGWVVGTWVVDPFPCVEDKDEASSLVEEASSLVEEASSMVVELLLVEVEP